MNIDIIDAAMSHSKEDGYIGRVEFSVEHQAHPYEITLHSKNAKEWMYSLNFARESGPEKDILLLEEQLEEDDELFDRLVEAAKSRLVQE
ncbi:hypothetical protein O9H85_14000 [Paenibacillus filicis]|uniref:IDEAL domain-containing protein n=1 Tax=Paenibacillus gyeongsangnamensis TaxID=3388067 RepID=A0ABT4Q9M6_9BACL|nr:hypothetical protein [Paenibacillus filicis]MCZ8513526.1 hypothetical protein [Paenibacillus filicis]